MVIKESNSKLYGKLCSQFYDATKAYAPEKEVNFYANFMRKDKRVLEAMSGSGRLLIPLVKLGYTVDGVDNSNIMLERCRKRAAEFQFSPLLFEESLENFVSPYKYSTVTIAVGSFQLLTDYNIALKSLQNIAKHMEKDGDLLIDIFTPDTSIEAQSIRIARIDDNKIIRLTTKHIFDEEKKIADAFCFYELISYGVVEEQENELMQITWYSDQELKELLKEAGLYIVKIHEKSIRSSGPSRIVHAKLV